MLMGNLFVFFQFQGKEHIDEATRRIVFIALISVAIVGVLFFCALRRVQSASDNDANDRHDRELDYQSKTNGIVGAFFKAIRLFFTRDMLLLSITFLYTGTLREAVCYATRATMCRKNSLRNFLFFSCQILLAFHFFFIRFRFRFRFLFSFSRIFFVVDVVVVGVLP